MKTGRLILVNAIIFLIIVALGVAGFTYYWDSMDYIDTDNAKVSADIIPVSVVSAGKITDWKAKVGMQVTADQELGTVATPNDISITSPVAGTIVASNGLKGQLVAPGLTLAQVADLSKLYIMANIEETDVKNVTVGQVVDIIVDVDKATTINGTVIEIGRATNSEFSLLPSQNASGDYTKEVEYVPVKISMENYSDKVVPGMNATVRIHR